MKQKVLSWLKWARAAVPVLGKFLPKLASFTAIIYVIIDLVVYVVQHFWR